MTDTAHKTAIALQYDGNDAPRVIAKGEGLIAEQILQLAQENDVPLFANADLAALLASVELGEEIPETLYRAIAEIIAFVYQLQASEHDAPSDKVWTPADLPSAQRSAS